MHDVQSNGTGNPKNLTEASLMIAARLQRLVEDAVPTSDGQRYELYYAQIDRDNPSPADGVNMLKCIQHLRIRFPALQPAFFHSLDSAADLILVDRISRCNDGQPILTDAQSRRIAEAGSIDRKLDLRRAFILKEFGEDDMADMLMNNPDEYRRRIDEGKAQIDALDQPSRDDEPMRWNEDQNP